MMDPGFRVSAIDKKESTTAQHKRTAEVTELQRLFGGSVPKPRNRKNFLLGSRRGRKPYPINSIQIQFKSFLL
jgi:hypothetical protein